MVEPVDVFSDRELKVIDRSPGSAVADELGFKERIAPGLVEGEFSQRRLTLGVDLTVVLVLLLDRCEVSDR